MINLKIKAHGVRGSIPVSDKAVTEYGGNTASYTIRTDDNTLIFLDAGTGIRSACSELDDVAEQVILAISHVHADHTMGLGMSKLPYINFNPIYNGKKAKMIGPEGLLGGLRQFYDGSKTWPVRATNSEVEPDWKGPNMPGLDFKNLEELIDGSEKQIDSKTKLETMKGSHPVEGGVLLYKISSENKIVVYATDNEFDFLNGGVPNPNAEAFKEKYAAFIANADVLIADAQYTEEEYIGKKPMNVQGFGHSYGEQIVDLANKANVKKVIVTHISPNQTDEMVAEREKALQKYVTEKGYVLQVEFAKEGMALSI